MSKLGTGGQPISQHDQLTVPLQVAVGSPCTWAMMDVDNGDGNIIKVWTRGTLGAISLAAQVI